MGRSRSGASERRGNRLSAGAGGLSGLLCTPGEGEWGYQRRLLVGDFGVADPAAGLGELAAMAARVAQGCGRARQRDDERGARVIDDYAAVHPPADRDRVVRQAWEEADRLRDEIDELLRHAGAANGSGVPGVGRPGRVGAGSGVR